METICDLCATAINLDEAETCTECSRTCCCTCGQWFAGEDVDGDEDFWLCDDCLAVRENVASVMRAEVDLDGGS